MYIMMYIDAHCHIVSDADLGGARGAGCMGVIMNSARMSEWGRVAEFAARNADVHAAVGIHPWYVDDVPPDWADALRDILRKKPDFMVGETGLDSVRGDMAAQSAVFSEHVKIAHEFGRALHVHCVGAWGRVLDILREMPRPPVVVFHAYSGAADVTRQLMRYNAYFSFGGGVLRPEYARMRAAVIAVPVGHMLVESDAPDSGLHISDIPNIINAIADLRGDAPDIIAAQIYENGQRVICNG